MSARHAIAAAGRSPETEGLSPKGGRAAARMGRIAQPIETQPQSGWVRRRRQA
jgi:hypothetical protein